MTAVDVTPRVSTLVELLQARADRLSDQPCLRLLVDGEKEQDRLTYEQLDLKARAFASHLASIAGTGDRAVLVYPPGAEFLVAFFGCIYAGVIAVPVAPPLDPTTGNRLAGVVADSDPSAVLTSAPLVDALRAAAGQPAPLILSLDDGAGADALDWRPERIDPHQIAMLQYTSGSTRQPRGVMVTHANLLSNLQWLKAGMCLPESPTIVSWLPVYHDMGLIGSLFQTVYNGGDCVLMSPLDFLAKPFRWLKALSDYHAFGSGSPPFGYDLCARKVTPAERETLDLHDWQVACVTAEPIRAAGLQRFADTFAQCGFKAQRFYPCYGLAETTLMVTGAEGPTKPSELWICGSELQRGTAVLSPDHGPDAVSHVSCGTARPGERVAIVDPDTSAERPDGRVGEIWVSGPNVTRGYWGRADETQAIFQAKLHDGAGPFLRTGDLGFILEGQLYVTGRLKDLLIIRGRNLYPHDIEWAAQAADPRLRPGCGAAFTVGEPDDPSIVLVNEISQPLPDGYDELTDAAGRSITETCGCAVQLVLIPARTIPKTSSGKVQRNRCRAMYLADGLSVIWPSDEPSPASDYEVHDSDTAATPDDPADKVERAVALLSRLIASAMLQRPTRLDIDTPLHRLGLDSLRALEIKDTLATSMGIEVPLRDFFGESSVRELAQRLAGRLGQTGVEPAPEPLTTGSEADEFALTDLQQAYCAGRNRAFQLGGVGAHVYSEFEASWLDTDRLESAWHRLIEHHDALRAVVFARAIQRIENPAPPWRLPVEDLRGRTPAETESFLETVREQMSHQVFPLDRWPLFDIRAYRLDDDRWSVHLSADLLTFDAASLLLLVQEWGRLYREPGTDLEHDTGYRRAIEERTKSRDLQRHQRSMDYWRQRLADLPHAPRLPMSSSRDGVVAPRFVRHSGSLNSNQWDRFTALAARARLTPSTALLAAYAEVLAAWAEDPCFTVSVTMQQKPADTAERAPIGPFSDFLLAGIDWTPGGSFVQRAQRLRDQLLEDLDHRDIGGVRVLREFARGKNMAATEAKTPVVFTPVLRDLSAFDWLGRPVGGVSQTPQVCLDNQLFLRDGGLDFHWDAVDDQFAQDVVADMVAAYQQLLERLSTDESAWTHAECFDLIPARQQRRRAQINATTSPIPQLRLEDLFTAQCQRDPDRPAVVGARSLTYADVNAMAAALACWLQSQGTQPGDLVAVVTEKGWEQVVAVLATLMCGTAYVPLSPDLPTSRLRLLLGDSGATIVLTQARLHDALSWPDRIRVAAVDAMDLSHMPATPTPPQTSPEDRCCVLFTSGSTGAPKGVQVHHRGMVNAILDTNRTFDIGPHDRTLAVTDLHHDMSAFDLFGPLAVGGAVVVVPHRRRRDPAAWIELIAQHRATIWNSVPASMQMLIEHAEMVDAAIPESLRLVFLGGDWIPLDLPGRIRDRAAAAEVVSVGGPTETTLWNIRYRIADVALDWTSIPYGTPIANTHYYVLDETLRERPDWVPGELCSAGAGTSSGYLCDPELTQTKFVRHPATGETLYRTGDFGRWLPEGTIEFLGRRDGQVQIDGRRVELREIETVLAQHPGVQSCVITSDTRGHGRQRIIAHVVVTDSRPADAGVLDSYLSAQLPTHMRPGQFRFIDSIPLNSNGKADRRTLAASTTAEAIPPRSTEATHGTAETVAAIVAKVLGVSMVPLDGRLEDLGVGSLEMIRIAGSLEETFGFRPDIDQMFTSSSIETLAQMVQHRTPEQVVTPADGGSRRYTIVSDPQTRRAFRSQRRGLRRDLGANRLVVKLPAAGHSQDLDRRHTSRAFLPRTTTATALGGLLSVLRDLDAGGTCRKHAYGSGGGTYSVQAYLHVKPGRVEDLAGGCYYYDPHEHTVVRLGSDANDFTEDLHWWWNRDSFRQSAFSIFLVAALDAIGPLYGERSMHFATLEAGLMTQLLEAFAGEHGLGLCQIGEMNFEHLRDLFALDDGHVLVHSMIGGPIAEAGPAATEELDDALARSDSSVSVVELSSKVSLNLTIHPGPIPPARLAQPVLLTGATGFLGGFVLRELLAQGHQVVCLARAPDSASVWNRLQRNADRLGVDWRAGRDAITTLPGDMSQTRFGLSEADFRDLAASIGAIYHCAAPVSWVKSYAALEPAIVGGAHEMLRLAVLEGAKPLHYVSTLAVFPFDGTAMTEDQSLDHGQHLLGGYAQAKWVGERLIAEALQRGLPVTVYRPPLVSGHSRTGVFNAESYFERMIKGCIELGEAPRLDGVIDVSPVDFVAAALVRISGQSATAGRVFHLNNPHPMAFDALVDWIRTRGYGLAPVPFSQWQDHLLSRHGRRDNALHPLTTHLRVASNATMTTAAHSCANTVAVLSASGLSCPAVSDELLAVYFDAFENSGYLNPLANIASSRRLA
jgi:amino acid adenylation domain-containing protein/thioester reductase-like protein